MTAQWVALSMSDHISLSDLQPADVLKSQSPFMRTLVARRSAQTVHTLTSHISG